MTTKEIYALFLKHPIVCTDSRRIVQGSIYVALKGGNFDGNAFAALALKAGAVYAVVDDASVISDERYLLVEDGLAALQLLAREHRNHFSIPVIGVTGSNGKTTTKELMNAVLSQRFSVLATKGNLNNHIGVPLTLVELTAAHDMAIIEMGASHPGNIAELCTIADPNFGLITNVGKAHMETMGGFEGVLSTKTELYRHLIAKNGVIFLNSSDAALSGLAKETPCFRYGTLPNADINGRAVRDGNFMSVQWRRDALTDWNDLPIVRTNLTGTYNLPNILAAVAVGAYFGLTDHEIGVGLAGYLPSNNRSEMRVAGSNLLILDAYNANPSSMEVALTNLLTMEGEYKSVILGEMLEVGATSRDEHRAVCQRLQTLNLINVCLVGKEFFALKDEFPFLFFENVDACIAWLSNHPLHNEVVLVKGSRGNKLEKVAEHLCLV